MVCDSRVLSQPRCWNGIWKSCRGSLTADRICGLFIFPSKKVTAGYVNCFLSSFIVTVGCVDCSLSSLVSSGTSAVTGIRAHVCVCWQCMFLPSNRPQCRFSTSGTPPLAKVYCQVAFGMQALPPIFQVLCCPRDTKQNSPPLLNDAHLAVEDLPWFSVSILGCLVFLPQIMVALLAGVTLSPLSSSRYHPRLQLSACHFASDFCAPYRPPTFLHSLVLT